MNNSFLGQTAVQLSVEEVNTEVIEDRVIQLRKWVSALEKITRSKEWSTLKEQIFEPAAEGLKKQLLLEAKKEHPDTERLNRLTGQITQSERYDLTKLEGAFRLELTNIMKNYGKKE